MQINVGKGSFDKIRDAIGIRDATGSPPYIRVIGKGSPRVLYNGYRVLANVT